MELIRKLIKKGKNQKGVTLIELLAVIVILGIIAAIGIPAVVNSRSEATANVISSDKAMVEQAAKQHLLRGDLYNAAAADATHFNIASLVEELSLNNGTIHVESDNANGKIIFTNSDNTTSTYTLDQTTGKLTEDGAAGK
ncbi:MAG: type II secretion system protein [Tumebacillaceae bacterium]